MKNLLILATCCLLLSCSKDYLFEIPSNTELDEVSLETKGALLEELSSVMKEIIELEHHEPATESNIGLLNSISRLELYPQVAKIVSMLNKHHPLEPGEITNHLFQQGALNLHFDYSVLLREASLSSSRGTPCYDAYAGAMQDIDSAFYASVLECFGEGDWGNVLCDGISAAEYVIQINQQLSEYCMCLLEHYGRGC